MHNSQEPNGPARVISIRNASTDQASHDNPLFVYIRIPGDIDPEERWDRFADPLEQTLAKDDLGNGSLEAEHNSPSQMKMGMTLLSSAESMLIFTMR